MPGSAMAEAAPDSGGSAAMRAVGKTPRLPPHNPLQFVKIQSPLYKKAEQQIKLTKEVKICREALKEGEEEWQSNLDNWKSRRRKVSEKVMQRAEEMRQIEAEEQQRQQQKKIKKFSEIVEQKSSRSYNFDLYIGPGDDSGLGATPEPDDTLDCQSSLLRSDTSEGMTSEAESVDSDIHKSEKVPEKEPPKVPQKPYSRFKKSTAVSDSDELFQHCLSKNDFDTNSSTEPSDVDTEATSSEEDVAISGQIGQSHSGLDSFHNNLAGSASDWSQEKLQLHLISQEERKPNNDIQLSNGFNQAFKICIKHGDVRGFGFSLKGGKDQGSPAYIENVVKSSPAAEIGLKDGDKIISLNGELTADSSHASLIFSIKQALYTGILDIVINRPEYCDSTNTEMKITESRKGKSFAEKLAIFTAGVNAPTTNIEEPKSKSVESNTESLVLRRRSAFENGKTENINVMNRRSSCISQPANTSCEETIEKRHSIDFALGQNITLENTSNKKGPPPPVPVKPKIKSKPAYFELNKSVLKTNETILHPLSCTENSSPDSLKEHLNSDSLGNKYQPTSPDLKSATENDINKKNLADSFVTKESFTQYEVTDKICDVSYHLLMNMDGSIPKLCNFDQVEGNTTDKLFASFEANELEPAKDLSDADVFDTIDDANSFCNHEENAVKDFGEDSFEHESDIRDYMCTFSKQLTNGVSSVHVDEQSTTECTIEGILFTADIDAEAISAPSACYSACDTNQSQDQNIQVLEESETDETNSSPLCLSLEKIDEDDVISASTTTSSGTPDTETVIETLPSNLSPLPNDESNGEDSSKFRDEEPTVTSSSVAKENYGDERETTDEHYTDNDKSYYREEYARELDESLDQITSLDVIDRIEQSLMDQLQKEDSYEDIGNERDDPWLYYSEESELLEDLTPRNLEPPRDPPPPPPPPEQENTIMPISRTNSTKRIKKELWRRRSDFLGLQSPEAVDNIPPPPPGLEELLKQEREQTQWLEKRLSLAEPEISSYSTCLDSQNYSSDDYFVEEDLESPKETEPEQWKENTEEESFFDATYGLHFESAQETQATVIGNVKLEESPQHKAKQNIQNLGAAPKAKIMDSTQWITEKGASVTKQTIEPQTTCNPHYWLAQDGSRQIFENRSDRRYSMPPVYSSTHPDVTVRTWGDREYEYEQHRPRSAIYGNTEKKDLQRTQSLDLNYDTDTLESEVHTCSCCGKGLCEGSAMGIEALHLYFHIECFRCCLCNIQLGNGSCGTDVQVKNNQLYCPACFTVD